MNTCHLTRRRIRHRLTQEIRSPTDSSPSADPVVLLGSIVRSLRAGLTLRQAIIDCGTRQMSELAHRMTVQLQRGRSLADVCTELSASNRSRRRTSSDESQLVVRVIGLAQTMGGDQAGLFEDVMHGIIERRRSHHERLTQAATAMSSMRLLTWLPAICGIWIAAENPTTRHFLLATTGGRICLSSGCLLNILGRLWSRRILRAP